jgi:tetratricopeptide (TPR) repeat protein
MTAPAAQPNSRLEQTVRKVVATLEASNQAEAVRLARYALSEGLEHPLFLNLRAFWLESRGRLEEALADLQRARELAPDDVPVLNALGLVLARLNRHVEATRVFEAAIERAPDFSPAYFNHAWTCATWGETDRARKSYLRAAELEAGNPKSAESLSRLATIAAQQGKPDESRDFARRALALNPTHTMAQIDCARADVRTGAYDAAEPELQKILAYPSLTALERYEAMGALAEMRHRQKRYADAFAIYAEGNAQYRKTAAPRYTTGESAFDAVQWMYRYYEKWPPAAPAMPSIAPATETACHVFLLGFIRSGTTLLEQALAAHPDVVTMEEKEPMAQSGEVFLGTPQALDHLHAMDEATRAEHVQAYWRNVREMGFEPGGKIFVDKQPFNTVKLPLIAGLFPDAKVIFAIRDPRDVLLSSMRQRLTINAITYELLDLERSARFYDAYMRFAVKAMEVLPLKFHRIRHEDVVDDFEGEVRRVCDFLGIAWNDSMANFADRDRTRSISSPSAAQIAKGLNRDGLAQWRRYEEQLAPILPILQPWVDYFGYSGG